MNPKTHDIIAIDVSKTTLQIHSELGRALFPNDSAGFAGIAKLAGKLPEALVEARISKAVAADPRASRQARAMMEVNGAGKVTAWSVLAYLPELASLSRGRLVALVGLAPYARDSGACKGKRSISGGKAKMRCPLFMAASSARIHNEHIKAFYERLRENGKPYKVAIVAVMRKLIIHLQSIIKKLEIELA